MKKRILSLVLCLALTLCVMPCSAQAGGLTYLALGDSITTGYGLENAQTEGFASLLAENLGYDLINHAVNGNTTTGLITQLVNPAILADIKNADLITITIGGNDMLALFFNAIMETYNTMNADSAQLNASDIGAIMGNPGDPRQMTLMMCAQLVLMGNPSTDTPGFAETETFRQGLSTYAFALAGIVNSIHAVNPDVKVIVATQYNPYANFTDAFAALNAGFETGVRMLNQAIVKNAVVGGYTVADVYGAFSGAEENLYNGCMEPLNMDIHPNAAGHKMLYECFFNTAMTLI